MSTAEHTPPGDDSFRSSLVRSAAGAVGLVVLVSAAFWAIGSIGGEPGTPVAGDDGADVAAPADDEGDADASGEDGGADDVDADDVDAAADADADGADDADGDADAGDTDADADAGEADVDAGADADGDGVDDGAEDGPADVDRSVAPAEVTIQVLDGFKEDGGAAADRVADLLGGVGYDIIARNDALSYEVTTVLYNPGNEAAAQQVAAELGGAEVREQPGNLSSAVALHVVVGADRG